MPRRGGRFLRGCCVGWASGIECNGRAWKRWDSGKERHSGRVLSFYVVVDVDYLQKHIACTRLGHRQEG